MSRSASPRRQRDLDVTRGDGRIFGQKGIEREGKRMLRYQYFFVEED